MGRRQKQKDLDDKNKMSLLTDVYGQTSGIELPEGLIFFGGGVKALLN